jgi:hypothetical protein
MLQPQPLRFHEPQPQRIALIEIMSEILPTKEPKQDHPTQIQAPSDPPRDTRPLGMDNKLD